MKPVPADPEKNENQQLFSHYHPSFNSYKFEFLKRDLKSKENLNVLKKQRISDLT